LFDNIHASGLNEPPAPLSVHVTNPIIFEDEFVVSVSVIVNVTCVPAENVAGLGVIAEVVGSSVFADNCDEPVLA
jgi:hypothetical protein